MADIPVVNSTASSPPSIRACAGSIAHTAVFSLPGAEQAVRLAMEKLILPEVGHVVRELTR